MSKMTDDEPATLRDVAEEAGVSIASASRALAGRGDLSRETRARVVAAAERLGYERAGGGRGRPTTLDPRLIEFVEALPRTQTGKLQRFELRRIAQEPEKHEEALRA